MLKSEIWVKAHIRRCFSAGLTAVIANKGAPEAGAVYVQVTISTNQIRIFSPAPGPAYNSQGARTWSQPFGEEDVSAEKATNYFSKQKSFDPDIWIIDIDDRNGTGLLELNSNTLVD